MNSAELSGGTIRPGKITHKGDLADLVRQLTDNSENKEAYEQWKGQRREYRKQQPTSLAGHFSEALQTAASAVRPFYVGQQRTP